MQQGSALVLFSGGQDSTVCLTWALQRYDRVETIGFDYGQRHAIELQTRTGLRERLRDLLPGAVAKLGDDHMLQLPTLGRISETSLTRATEIEMGEAGLPSTFVPGRNLLFFTYAAALGWRRGITTLVGGMCETDYSGYPDCRQATLSRLAEAISLGMDRPIHDRNAADARRQGRHVGDGRRIGRRGAGRSDHRVLSHLLSRRSRAPP